MKIQHIKLHNFRSYKLFTTDIGDGGTVIIGDNGVGKTNLLEAIYITLQGSGFRGSLVDCIRIEQLNSTLLLETSDETRRVSLQKSDRNRVQKIFTINHQKSKNLPLKNRLPVILFEPNELKLITSSPTRRRDFLDNLISRLDHSYEKTIRTFNRTLMQRNELLKTHTDDKGWQDNLFAWNIRFCQLARQIIEMRTHFLYSNQPLLNEIYNSLAGQKTTLKIQYLSPIKISNYGQLLLDKLNQSLAYELVTGHTSCGPHREDFLISIHNQPANKVASRGEMRTIMLAFKLLELQLQTAQNDLKPIILMDDVFSELDAKREKLLQETIKNHQFIFTTTEPRHRLKNCKIITIK